MNRFEKAVYECMDATARLLEKTSDPFHRAILLNFWRHVHLEGSGQYDRIVSSDMMADHPVYRVAWGANPAVIEGKDGVLGFYNSVGEAVLWNSDELTFHQIAPGAILKQLSYPVEKDDAIYHVSSRQAFIWPYDEKARLKGENLYEDKTSLQIEEIDPSEAITPKQVRDIHLELLDRLEKKFGPEFWVYRA
jgi:hypothetical protein